MAAPVIPSGPPAVPLRTSSRIGALAEPHYRRYWLGTLGSVAGSQLVMLGMGWVIVDTLDGSALILGIVGAATAVPTIVLNLFGGVLADRLDRRKVLIISAFITTLLFALLTVLDATGVLRIWHVVAIAGGLGLVYGVDWPSRNAFFPLLIGRHYMMSAVALNAMAWQGIRIVAPAFGGVIIAVAGTPVVFALSAIGAFAMFTVLVTLRVPPVEMEARSSDVLGDLREGFSFILDRRLFIGLIALTYASMFFGMQYINLMPLMAKAFDVGSSELGLLFTAVGGGAMAGTLVTLRLNTSAHLGRILLAGVFFASLFVIGFAAAPGHVVGMALIFCSSLANSVFSISSMTALQLRVPDALRGRVMGIHTITFSLIPLGSLMGGAIAEVTSVRVALAVSAAILAVIVVLVALSQREVRALDGRAEV